MTTSDPDQIRQQIEGTRRDLSADVNALTEKVSPSRAVGRRVERARGAMADVKDKIMGSTENAASTVSGTTGSMASDVSDRMSSAASSVADTVGSAPRTVRRRARGNPLAAGLVAFGLGWLISSLLPASRKEQELAGQARDAVSDRMQPVAEGLRQAGSEVADNLREPAQQAVQSVKSTAGDAASTVADEGRAAADHVSERTQEARDTVRDEAR